MLKKTNPLSKTGLWQQAGKCAVAAWAHETAKLVEPCYSLPPLPLEPTSHPARKASVTSGRLQEMLLQFRDTFKCLVVWLVGLPRLKYYEFMKLKWKNIYKRQPLWRTTINRAHRWKKTRKMKVRAIGSKIIKNLKRLMVT